MRKIDATKLKNANTLLDAKYGKEGTASRDEFNKEAIAYYYGEILKEKRKELNLTQEQLSEKVGLKRSYIAKIEKGATDMQMSSFVRIAQALGLKLLLS
ncbi:HTH-type transcriptional regulator/antitoxin HipB [Dysgonomonas sp. PH5-45]|uniref:helix-turn-helix domain-containing protein n=1 Tax=unclassified Dysgonomonas TaxID=2630389 RepID=UPI002477232A|nr:MULTISPECIES: helix-turn-helix transcriptional regulator [unclassified Dysgonomonas]MDH6356109.1 HTH-type transcriptional regulator/antitoxin HipB [Dysgonomonas sp. PH5-45]MDH6389006.1 HTH-type transcriptional regulator/antitoxin HipB [Dysgonomonas sp. PH5-37]